MVSGMGLGLSLGLRLGVGLGGGRDGSVVETFDPSGLFTGGRTGVLLIASPANTGVSVNTAVTNWTDLSPAGRTVTQGTSSRRPVLRQDAGSRYYVEFDGTDDYLEIADLNLGASVSIFAALTLTAQTSGGSIHRPFFASLTEDTYAGTGTGTTYGVGLSRSGSDAIRATLGNGSTNDSLLHVVSQDGALAVIEVINVSTAAALELDGTGVDTATFSRTTGFGTGYSLGAHAGTNGLVTLRAYGGNIYGFLAINGTLTSGERADVLTYMAALQGRSL